MARQRKLLESRYNLEPKLDPTAKMSRGKPLVVGPTARLPKGMDWETLAAMSPEEIRRKDVFPYKALPHPVQGGGLGGQVFPQMQIKMFPRWSATTSSSTSRSIMPEFPPAMFLQNRPSSATFPRRGRVDQQLLPPVQGHPDARAARRPTPAGDAVPPGGVQSDRRPQEAEPSLGVTCLDCHVNGHTSGQFHINPDTRPEQRRMRLDTVSLRGLFNQQIHGSKRSLRSVEDFTEFEQRTAYFNGDEIHAIKKGMNILDRIQVTHMAQMQNMFDFPPAPKLTPLGRLDPEKATESELRGEKLFFGKAQCAGLPPGAVLPRQPDARPAPGALPERRGGRRTDQELHAARHQGQPAVPARRPLPDPGGHGRVLQPRPGAEADEGGEADLVAFLRQL